MTTQHALARGRLAAQRLAPYRDAPEQPHRRPPVDGAALRARLITAGVLVPADTPSRLPAGARALRVVALDACGQEAAAAEVARTSSATVLRWLIEHANRPWMRAAAARELARRTPGAPS